MLKPEKEIHIALPVKHSTGGSMRTRKRSPYTPQCAIHIILKGDIVSQARKRAVRFLKS
jgi:hypothetical protein